MYWLKQRSCASGNGGVRLRGGGGSLGRTGPFSPPPPTPEYHPTEPQGLVSGGAHGVLTTRLGRRLQGLVGTLMGGGAPPPASLSPLPIYLFFFF